MRPLLRGEESLCVARGGQPGFYCAAELMLMRVNNKLLRVGELMVVQVLVGYEFETWLHIVGQIFLSNSN